MKLHQLPPGSVFRVATDLRVPPGAPALSVDQMYRLGNVDGMYSYCFDKDGGIVHVGAGAEVELVALPPLAGGLYIWTVYDSPSDYPGQFVARLYARDRGTNLALTAATLDQLRAMLPPGLSCIARSPDDDPVIVESWL
jgi:hypothetical protein